jgi:CO dehydrogenase/acetyl-CoA synthase alpha subunit
MTEARMPETIVEIKKWLQKFISKNARVIDKNDQIRRFNSGETKWKPMKRGYCNWLKISTDAKRHVMIWTIDGSDYMKAQARILADNVEEIIKKELNQIVPVEFKDATKWVSTSQFVVPTGQPDRVTITHVGLCGIRTGNEPVEDECPF